jgi:hypothetical protein
MTKKIFLSVLFLVGCSVSFAANQLLTQIKTKVATGDVPKGTSTENYNADKEPHLADLVRKASEDKKPAFIPVMTRIMKNKEIYWELRQQAIQYLSHFPDHLKVRAAFRLLVMDATQPKELREGAYFGLKSAKLTNNQKARMLKGLNPLKDADGELTLNVAEDLSQLGEKKIAKRYVESLLAKKDLELPLRDRATKLLAELN